MFFFAAGRLFFLIHFRFPTTRDVNQRLGQANGLKNKLLSVQTASMCLKNDEDFSAFVWREHQRRLA